MGTLFGNIGKAIGKGVKDVGHVAGTVASNPITELAAGAFCGPACAAALGGLGKLAAPGGNLGKAAIGAGTGALTGYAGSKLGGMVKGALGANTGGNILQRIGGVASDVGGNVVKGLGKATGVVGADGGLDFSKLLGLGAAGAAFKGQQDATKKANEYFGNMLDMHKQQLAAGQADYASRAPMRSQAQATIASKLNGMGKNIYQPYTGV